MSRKVMMLITAQANGRLWRAIQWLIGVAIERDEACAIANHSLRFHCIELQTTSYGFDFAQMCKSDIAADANIANRCLNRILAN